MYLTSMLQARGGGVLPCMAYMGGQGIVFVLSVLNSIEFCAVLSPKRGMYFSNFLS